MMQLNALGESYYNLAVAAELTCCAKSIIVAFWKTVAGCEFKHKAESHIHSRLSESIPEKQKTTSSLEYGEELRITYQYTHAQYASHYIVHPCQQALAH